jgi:hypothetical protein
MSDSVTLLVPVDATYRVLAPDVARKFLEIAGGPAGDADALAESLAAALTRLTEGAAAGAGVSLDMGVDAGSVEIRLRCGDRSAVVTHPLPARKSS